MNELPETLDETYERILKGINKAQKDNAHRLLRCLTVAVRPLRVGELAEFLAFDFHASTTGGGLPTLKEDWRWDDEEEAVLSTCSSLITIIPHHYGDSRIVQFSHFSVKEFLTSHRLARSPHEDISRFRIDLESAHTIMAQACLATLLRQSEHAGNSDSKKSPLVNYAAEHWVDHAQFGKVSSRVREGMDDIFDKSQPHFAAWLQVHDIDDDWNYFSPYLRNGVGSPLYYAASCGLYDVAECLILKYPEQVNAIGGRNLFPLPAALHKKHFRVANLLFKHDAVVDVRGQKARTPMYTSSLTGSLDIMRWLLNHGADSNARSSTRGTPLHIAAYNMDLDAVQVLLKHNANPNLQNYYGRTPLHMVLINSDTSREGQRLVVTIVRQLLEHGASPSKRDNHHTTPLHEASSRGRVEVVRLLLSYGVKIDDKDKSGRTPLQLAASRGYSEIPKLLVERGAVPH